MIKKVLFVFFISMLPIVELRGAIPYGIGIGVPFHITYAVAVIGNLVPVPFLIIFAKRILEWLSTSEAVGKFVINFKIKKTYLKKGDFMKRFLKNKYVMLTIIIVILSIVYFGVNKAIKQYNYTNDDDAG